MEELPHGVGETVTQYKERRVERRHAPRAGPPAVTFPARLPIGNPVENSPGNRKGSPGTYTAAN